MTIAAAGGARYGDVFAVREFRFLWLADVLSLVGDQLARVALSILVFTRTGSAALTAFAFALTFLPWVIGAPLLSGVADRRPRRQVMIACDLGRAALVGMMAVPWIPLWVTCGLLACSTLMAPPFSSARAAVLPDVLPGDAYVLGSAVTHTTNQAAQVLGFATGGAAVLALGTHRALAADALTFLLSAALLRTGLQARPASAGSGRGRLSSLTAAKAGARLVFGNSRLRTLTGYAWLCSFYVVPEALAVPYAHHFGRGATSVGLLLAASPLGNVIGALALSRLVSPARRLLCIGPLAVLSCLTLTLCIVQPALPLSFLIWSVSGMFSAYQVPANAAFVVAVPVGHRAQAFGLVQAGIFVLQGLAFVLAGLAADMVAPSTVIAVSGLIGAIVAGALVARTGYQFLYHSDGT